MPTMVRRRLSCRTLTGLFMKLFVFFALALIFTGCYDVGKSVSPVNSAILQEALDELRAGDTLWLEDGVWRDVRITVNGKGEAGKPVVVKARNAGKAVIKGRSQLNISGRHVIVDGLYFTEGSAPGEAVIIFRNDETKEVAQNCRVTNCAIDGYNQEHRFKQDSWVLLYGKNNRLDHNYFANKLNTGVTVVVQLNGPENQQNFHQIDHNYFGHRPLLGSNGGETIRIGVSTFSLSASNTTVEYNYFERCNGEAEVVSVKSGENVIRRNTFFESQGSLVLRHGNNNVVEENYFIGNGVANTGGLRIINEGHTIRGNVFQDLTGTRFFSALALMNGVPNSSINRYHQVRDVTIADNVFVNCTAIEFGTGADSERTAPPVSTRFENNVVVGMPANAIRALAPLEGISFVANRSDERISQARGFLAQPFTVVRNQNGVIAIAGVGKTFSPYATRENTGPSWLKDVLDVRDSAAPRAVFEVTPADDLVKIIGNSNPGAIIELTKAGLYKISKSIPLTHPVTLRSKANLDSLPVIAFEHNEENAPFFIIENGGSMVAQGLKVNGTSGGGVAEAFVVTSARPMISHYNLSIDGCHFYGFSEGGYGVIKANPGSFADSVSVVNSTFSEISGVAVSLAAEKDDKGRYNAERVVVSNCLFRNVNNTAIDVYRGGTDESTAGPHVIIDHCVFDNVCNQELGSVIRLPGVQWAEVKNTLFANSGTGGRSILFEDPAWVYNSVYHCAFYNSGRVESFYPHRTGEKIIFIRPETGSDYMVNTYSTLSGAASDGRSIGLIQVEKESL